MQKGPFTKQNLLDFSRKGALVVRGPANGGENMKSGKLRNAIHSVV